MLSVKVNLLRADVVGFVTIQGFINSLGIPVGFYKFVKFEWYLIIFLANIM